ncbi:MAG: carboxypeptidase regulatory-like domain-containing protein, partial [Acidobacteria bacterium]|nr:carboxypeptidase regulatory-like domain-containing protein [Acidobacteriota bacterium]
MRLRILILLLLAMAGAVDAQTTTGQITGVIQDASKAVIPGAKVMAANVQTGLKREASTNDLGYYSFPLLPPGTYRVVAQKEGFRPVSQTGITLSVDDVARVDLVLQLGPVSSSVEVSAAAAPIERETAAMGTVVEGSKIVNLPLNSRNSFSLALLVPGVVPGRGFGDLFNNAAGFHINGGRANTNEMLIDGITNVAPAANPIAVVAIMPSPDALQEFKVITNSYSAEYGRSGGGIVNMIMRSGTNQYHGALFEFLRNSKMDSNDFFANRAGTPLTSFQRNQFGFTFGGPVKHDKLFYFVNYEGLRQLGASSVNLTVPTVAERTGDFSQSFQKIGNRFEHLL